MVDNKKSGDIAKYLVISIIGISLYLVAGKLGLSLASLNKSASPVWPPSGLAIASLIILGYRYFPSVFIGAFLLNLTTTPSIPVSLGIATGNTLEALFGAFLMIRYAGGKYELEKVKSIFAFFIIAAIAPLTSSIIGVLSLFAGGLIESSNLIIVWLTWWTGDAVGTILIVPLILSLYNSAPIKIKKEHYPEIGLAMFLLIIISAIIFIGWPIQINKSYYLKFLCVPPLIWIAWRSCLRVSVISTTILSIIAITGVYFNTSLFDASSENTSLILLQLFLSVVIIIALSISTMSVQYRNAIDSFNKKQKKR